MKKSRTAEQCIETRAHKSFNYGKCTLMNPTNTNMQCEIYRASTHARVAFAYFYLLFSVSFFLFHFILISSVFCCCYWFGCWGASMRTHAWKVLAKSIWITPTCTVFALNVACVCAYNAWRIELRMQLIEWCKYNKCKAVSVHTHTHTHSRADTTVFKWWMACSV